MSETYHQKRYREDPAYRAQQKAKNAANLTAGYSRQRTTGMPPEIYHQLLIEQAGCCGICDKPMKGPKEPAADHDHNNPGVYRGLLCAGCNAFVGHVEQPGKLDRVQAYLAAHTYTA